MPAEAGAWDCPSPASSEIVTGKSVIWPGLQLKWEGDEMIGGAKRPSRGGLPVTLPATLEVVKPLGPKKPSAVWLCKCQGIAVVLKLFGEEVTPQSVDYDLNDREEADPCRWEQIFEMENNAGPATDLHTVHEVWNFIPSPELICYREAIAYLKLQDLQGHAIPQSYGFYRFALSDQIDGAWATVAGHISEYIVGESPRATMDSLFSNKQVNEEGITLLLSAILDVFEDIHGRGVAHQDIGSRNMTVDWPDRSLPPRIVVYDFGRAAFGKSGYISRREMITFGELLDDIGLDVREYAHNWLYNGPGRERLDAFYRVLKP